MKRIFRICLVILIALILTLNYAVVLAAPPSKPGGESGNDGQGSNTSVTHTGNTEISSDTNNNEMVYSSEKSSENSLLVTGGTSTLTNATISKTGDADGDNSDFYGTNAAVLVKEGTLNIDGGTVTTNGSHANGIFAYSKGIINVSNTIIKTTSNNSGAIMVTGGGTLTANNVTAETDGNSSAPIRSDRGGGTLVVNGGTYTSHGTGSPVIYSTADITVNNSMLTSTASEGVVVEGKNSVTLNKVSMEATNTKLNGNSETYKSIFIYQSMSGDADVGTSSFTAKDSKIINNKGDIIFVTNTSTTIELENNEIINNDSTGGFLKIGAAKWGTSGSNGGTVSLNAKNQKIEGNIEVDSISTLDFSLSNGSSYTGTINGDNTAKKVSITLDSNSTLTLTGDSYITELNNSVEDNSNINLNGYTLHIGEAATTSNDSSVETKTDGSNNSIVESGDSDSNSLQSYEPIIYVAVAIAVTIVITVVIAIVIDKILKAKRQ